MVSFIVHAPPSLVTEACPYPCLFTPCHVAAVECFACVMLHAQLGRHALHKLQPLGPDMVATPSRGLADVGNFRQIGVRTGRCCCATSTRGARATSGCRAARCWSARTSTPSCSRACGAPPAGRRRCWRRARSLSSAPGGACVGASLRTLEMQSPALKAHVNSQQKAWHIAHRL